MATEKMKIMDNILLLKRRINILENILNGKWKKTQEYKSKVIIQLGKAYESLEDEKLKIRLLANRGIKKESEDVSS